MHRADDSLQNRPGPGEPLHLRFRGHFVGQAPEPGMLPRAHLVVDEFIEFLPGASCAGSID